MTSIIAGYRVREGHSIRKNLTPIHATAAYSFRQLNTLFVPSGYAGANIQIIRDFDHTTHEVKFSGGWRDDVDMVDFVTAHGTHPGAMGYLQIHYDQSGNGLDAVQFSTGQQPIVVDTGVAVTQNGLPSAYYDGNMFLEAAYSSSDFPNICASTFLVANFTDTGTTRTALSLGSNSDNNHFGVGLHNVGDYNYYYPLGFSLWGQRPGESGLMLFVTRNLYSICEASYRTNEKTGGALGGSTPLMYNILSTRNNPLAGTIRIGATKLYGSHMYGYISEAIAFNNNNQDVYLNQTLFRELDIKNAFGL